MRPTRTAMLLDVARIIAQRSTCGRLHVGAVVAREGRILTTGYNGAPAGMAHCVHTVPGPTTLPQEACGIAVHAEANAIAFAARYGMATEGAELYTTHAPCPTCAKLIVNAGIVKVAYSHGYRDMTGIEMLRAAGIGVA